MPGKTAVQSQCPVARSPVSAGEFFQQFRGQSTGEFVRAVSKDFGEILLCNYRIVLVLFRRTLRRLSAPGFWNVFGPAAVPFTVADWLPRPIKFTRFQLSSGQLIRCFSHSIVSSPRGDHEKALGARGVVVRADSGWPVAGRAIFKRKND